MRKTHLIGCVVLLSVASAWSQDEFSGLTCGADIPKALIGKHFSNERVVVTEGRHKDLGLKDLGGDEISDRLFLGSWRICGSEYELLIDNKQNVIRDVLAFPAHSTASPMMIGACQVDGKDSPDTVLAVLNNSGHLNARDETQAKAMLRATAAWKIDETKAKFEKMSAENLSCPLGDIITDDGGQ